ncbi:hypothetical protein B0G76_0529 [Paraburkholderia sp. BL23I1N1]|nr:hypothetical protein B0G76_0529 [Paraburkholderia sp. BL23I1N1]
MIPAQRAAAAHARRPQGQLHFANGRHGAYSISSGRLLRGGLKWVSMAASS